MALLDIFRSEEEIARRKKEEERIRKRAEFTRIESEEERQELAKMDDWTKENYFKRRAWEKKQEAKMNGTYRVHGKRYIYRGVFSIKYR